MINEVERMHGVVLARIIRESGRAVSVEADSAVRSAYLVERSIPLYIKYSTSRMSPWRFSFTNEQQSELQSLVDGRGTACVVFVCGEDGLVSLTSEELRQVLDEVFEGVEWVRIARRPHGQYAVSGSDGEMQLRVADNAFPRKMLDLIEKVPGPVSGDSGC